MAAMLWPAALFGAPKWAPVSPEILQATQSEKWPEAEAEILFSRHVMTGDLGGTFVTSHVQAKIYTEKGVQNSSLFEIRHPRNFKTSELAGRVVKPDGTAVELGKNDFHRNTLAKAQGVEIVRVTFTFPDLQPGDVIEYRWASPVDDSFGSILKYHCENWVPTREFSFSTESARNDYQVMWFNCVAESNPKKRTLTIRDLPAFVPEPLMPTESEFRGWVAIVFNSPYLRFFSKGDSVWREIGKWEGENFRLRTNPNKVIKAKAAEIIAQASSPEEKLDAIHRYVQSEIHNFGWFSDAEYADAKKKRDSEEDLQTASKTLDRKTGYSREINELFASLARAAGFEVRLSLSASRNDVLSIQRPNGFVFINRYGVAVKFGDAWRIYMPGVPFAPTGHLRASDEGAMIFVCDEKQNIFTTAQIAPAEATHSLRKGTFTLDEDGTLEGTVNISLTGHRAIRMREDWWGDSTEEMEESLRKNVAERLPTAELTEIQFRGTQDSTRPATISYHVRVPGYADVIGTRLAFATNYFEANAKQLFTSETRKYPIFLEFAETGTDEIELTLPEGYTLDAPTAPTPVRDPSGVISANYEMRYSAKARLITYKRSLLLGGQGITQFAAASYDVIRGLMSRIHTSNTHRLVIKPKPAPEEPKA